MEVQLDTGVPIANGILTCDTDEQAEVRMQPKGPIAPRLRRNGQPAESLLQ